MQGDRQVGFASSTIDTTEAAIIVNDYLVADLPVGGKARRTTARTNVTLSRALHMSNVRFHGRRRGRANSRRRPHRRRQRARARRSSRRAEGRTRSASRSPGRCSCRRSCLSPPRLGEQPKVGKHYVIPVFDPARHGAERRRHRRARRVARSWSTTARRTTRRRRNGTACCPIPSAPGGLDADRRVDSTGGSMRKGASSRRRSWASTSDACRTKSHSRTGETTRVTSPSPMTATSSRRRRSRRTSACRSASMRFVFGCTGVALARLRSQRRAPASHRRHAHRRSGAGQRLSRAGPARLHAPAERATSQPRANDPEQGPADRGAARQIAGASATRGSSRANQPWVHDSISDRITFGMPNALQVLKTRTGDCNEHTQLFVALARAVGMPARIAAGLAYVDGKFYYHAWPEILLNDWVAGRSDVRPVSCGRGPPAIRHRWTGASDGAVALDGQS